MDKETQNALDEFECGDNPTMRDMEREVWEDDWYKQTQDDIIEISNQKQYEEDFPL